MKDIKFSITPETQAFFDATIFGKTVITEITLEGEPGCGKTLSTRWIADKLKLSDKYFRLVCTKETSFEHFTTEKIIKDGDIVEQDSMFLQLLQEPSVLVVDEVYLAQPDVIAGLNSLLDFDKAITLPNGRTFKRHPKNIMIFSSNPKSYAGVKRQHGGFLDRLPTLLMHYSKKEPALLLEAFPDMDKDVVAQICKFASLVRNARATKNLTTVVSTRGLLTIANMIANGCPLDLAVRSAIKAPPEEEKIISELMNISLNATIVKNEKTGEDELSIFAKLQDEVEAMNKKLKKAEADKKAWQDKAKKLLDTFAAKPKAAAKK